MRTPYTTPSSGSSPYAPLPTTPEISTTPPNTTGIATSVRFSGRSPRNSHASSPTSTTWMLPSTVARPAPDRLDRVVPERQVRGEHHARAPQRQAVAERARPVAALLARGRAATAPAAPRSSGRTRRWTATPPRAARGSPRTRSRRRRAPRRERAGQTLVPRLPTGIVPPGGPEHDAVDARGVLRRLDHVRRDRQRDERRERRPAAGPAARRGAAARGSASCCSCGAGNDPLDRRRHERDRIAADRLVARPPGCDARAGGRARRVRGARGRRRDGRVRRGAVRAGRRRRQRHVRHPARSQRGRRRHRRARGGATRPRASCQS